MNLFLEEHGEAILYGVIGMTMVLLICLLCQTKWKDMSPSYRTRQYQSNAGFVAEAAGKKPKIEADEIVYAKFRDTAFDCRDYVKAKDFQGRDISRKINIYGTVNVFQRGVYRLRCVVVADNMLASTKYVNVIVE